MQVPSHFEINQLPHSQPLEMDTVKSRLVALLDKNKKTLAQLLTQNDTYTWENLMRPIEDMEDELHHFWSPIAHLHSVKETDQLRKVYNEALPLLTEYHTAIAQNEKLYQAILQIAESDHFASLTPAQQKIIRNDIRDFKLAGIHLPAADKKRFSALQQELSLAMTTFSEHVLDATQHFFLHFEDKAALSGLPDQAIKLAEENAALRQLKGYVLTLDFPSYSTAVRYLHDRELRKQLYDAYVTRASNRGPDADKWDNEPIIQQILSLRLEMARLVGFNSYAEFALQTKMAKSPDEVMHFLKDLLMRSHYIAQSEFQELRDFAKSLDHLVELKAWDVAYYAEKLQHQKFNFTQEEVRPYFPITKVLSGLFSIMQQVYGLTIQVEPNVPTWDKNVQFLSIKDSQQRLRGGLYIDLYARRHKRDGAWMDDAQARRLLSNGQLQLPIAYLTCNFMPPVGDDPALLTHDDVLTLFHEFGHCLHHLLTLVDYPAVGGINGVAWDAVEFPSQFLEYFCWEKASLDLIAEHYQTKEKLPDDLFNNMVAGKNFQTGLQMVRQLEFAIYDFRLHLEFDPTEAGQSQRILNEVRKTTTFLPVLEYNRFQNSFSHIFAGGYAAGYYSYKWAEVLSADAFAKFEENGVFNREIGQSFVENVLQVGGVREPMESFIAFRGRPPKLDALLKYSGITEMQSN